MSYILSGPTVSAALKALAEEGYIFADDAYVAHLKLTHSQGIMQTIIVRMVLFFA